MQDGQGRAFALNADPLAMRIYTDEESQFLDTDCRGFLLFLEQIQVLNLETREMVINRVMALDAAEFNLEDLKWVILWCYLIFQAVKCLSANGRSGLEEDEQRLH